jgi:hypothetical protein
MFLVCLNYNIRFPRKLRPSFSAKKSLVFWEGKKKRNFKRAASRSGDHRREISFSGKMRARDIRAKLEEPTAANIEKFLLDESQSIHPFTA